MLTFIFSRLGCQRPLSYDVYVCGLEELLYNQVTLYKHRSAVGSNSSTWRYIFPRASPAQKSVLARGISARILRGGFPSKTAKNISVPGYVSFFAAVYVRVSICGKRVFLKISTTMQKDEKYVHR